MDTNQPASNIPTPSLATLFEQTKDERVGESLQPDATDTPFSTFFWAAIRYMKDGQEADKNTAEAQFAEDIEWQMMNNGQFRKGKKEVLAFCWAGGFGSAKTPAPIFNSRTEEWGVWEYWNIGTLTKEIVQFAKQSEWRFPHDPDSLVGKTYKIPVCFVYRINADGKIDRVREYLDMNSLMSQFE